jgi:aquaporin related protein
MGKQINVRPPSPGLEDTYDQQLLAKLGYKQELRRSYSTVQIFAIAFSIMGLVPSIASTIPFSLPAGPAGMVWVRPQRIYLYCCTIRCPSLRNMLNLRFL